MVEAGEKPTPPAWVVPSLGVLTTIKSPNPDKGSAPKNQNLFQVPFPSLPTLFLQSRDITTSICIMPHPVTAQLPDDFVASYGPNVVCASTDFFWSTIPQSGDDLQEASNLPEPPAKRLRVTKARAEYALRHGSELPSSHLPSPSSSHNSINSTPPAASVIRRLT